MAANPTVDFNGHKIKYNRAALSKWSVQRKLFTPNGQFEAMDAILFGKADEVAEMLGDEMQAMVDLLTAIVEQEGSAKN